MIKLFGLLMVGLFKVTFQVTWWLLKIVSKGLFFVTAAVVMLIISICVWLFCKIFKKPPPDWLFKFNVDKASTNVSEMDGHEFEHHCAKHLMKNGFSNVRVTQASGDYGADIIANDKHGETWVFQCKRYKGKVSNKAVQEVVAAKAHYKACNAGVITNSQLTEQARELAFENAVMLFELMG